MASTRIHFKWRKSRVQSDPENGCKVGRGTKIDSSSIRRDLFSNFLAKVKTEELKNVLFMNLAAAACTFLSSRLLSPQDPYQTGLFCSPALSLSSMNLQLLSPKPRERDLAGLFLLLLSLTRYMGI